MTTLVYNADVYLKNKNFCEALVIKDGRIARTGSSKELLEDTHSSAQKIDAEGALVLPAFYDSHLHLMWAGRRAGGIEGAGAKSIDEVIKRGREYIARIKPRNGAYIQGAGINPDLFTSGEKRDLRREDIDKISTEHPVILSRHCGHIIYCNSMALSLAGFSDSAPEVEGGTIEKDNNGRPTGICRENANALVRKPMPPASRGDMKTFLRLAMDRALSLGITACGSYDSSGPDFDTVAGVYKEIYDDSLEKGVPAVRITMQCGVSAKESLLDAHIKRGIPFGTALWECPEWGTFLKMGPLKLFADGTLGGRTAWMRRPYSDESETRGFPVIDEGSLNRFVTKAAAAGVQVLIHAIGDAGIDAAISALEKVTPHGENPLRHGIVHCQITSPDLLERMKRAGILAFVQPAFLADDAHILESRVGAELASTSYAWASMEKLGISVNYGTDCPVSPLDPLLGILWAVNRGTDGRAYNPAEKVDIYTAVDAYTARAAFSAFDERSLGRIEEGKIADLVFLDKNIFTIPPEDIHKAKVLKTICAGIKVYEN